MANKDDVRKEIQRGKQKLDRVIKRIIRDQPAVDTGLMLNTTTITGLKIVDITEIPFTFDYYINTTFYYDYVDLGTYKFKGYQLTQQFLDDEKTQEVFEDIYEKYFEYLIDEQFK